jgi:hypothetical protein
MTKVPAVFEVNVRAVVSSVDPFRLQAIDVPVPVSTVVAFIVIAQPAISGVALADGRNLLPVVR